MASDIWSSPNYLSFMAVICTYIDEEWELKKDLLDFVPLMGSHTGENIAVSFLKSMNELEIEGENVHTKKYYFFIFVGFFNRT